MNKSVYDYKTKTWSEVEMTQEEIEALQNQNTPPSEPTLEERVNTLESNTEALKIILGVDS